MNLYTHNKSNRIPDDAWDVIGLCGAACGVHKHLIKKNERERK